LNVVRIAKEKDHGLNAKISGLVLFLFSELVSRTCRFSIKGLEEIEEIRENDSPAIATSWHGMTMMVLGSMRNYFDISSFTLFFPDDPSGEALADFVRRLGMESALLNLEGDPSLEMSSKLLSVIRKIKSGRNSLIHPDGPRGPAYIVKPGLTAIARMTGAAIIPLGCYCRNAYHVPRWDRYTLPLPFSKINIQIGTPITISKDLVDLDQTNRDLEDILNRLAHQAAANYYVPEINN